MVVVVVVCGSSRAGRRGSRRPRLHPTSRRWRGMQLPPLTTMRCRLRRRRRGSRRVSGQFHERRDQLRVATLAHVDHGGHRPRDESGGGGRGGHDGADGADAKKGAGDGDGVAQRYCDRKSLDGTFADATRSVCHESGWRELDTFHKQVRSRARGSGALDQHLRVTRGEQHARAKLRGRSVGRSRGSYRLRLVLRVTNSITSRASQPKRTHRRSRSENVARSSAGIGVRIRRDHLLRRHGR